MNKKENRGKEKVSFRKKNNMNLKKNQKKKNKQSSEIKI